MSEPQFPIDYFRAAASWMGEMERRMNRAEGEVTRLSEVTKRLADRIATLEEFRHGVNIVMKHSSEEKQ